MCSRLPLHSFVWIFYPFSLDKILSLFLSNARFELNFAVNVLGTYAMTELMLPLLEKATPDARVITVSSGGMYTTPLTKDLQVIASMKFCS